MQYLLTQAEYDNLLERARMAARKADDELLELCKQAALHIPVDQPWRAEGKGHQAPWGCILVPDHDPGYCDDCPASNICPYGGKQWSQ